MLKHPQILLASNLKDGEVMFLGATGWEHDYRLARVAHTAQEAKALEEIGQKDYAANEVVDVYLTDVALTAAGAPAPLQAPAPTVNNPFLNGATPPAPPSK